MKDFKFIGKTVCGYCKHFLDLHTYRSGCSARNNILTIGDELIFTECHCTRSPINQIEVLLSGQQK